MITQLRFILILCLLTILPGQIIRFPPASFTGAVNLTDITVLFLDIFFVIYALTIRKSIKFPSPFVWIILFSLAALSSNVLALGNFSVTQVLASSFFLARFTIYAFVAVVVYNIIGKKELFNWLNAILFVGVVFAFVGLIQFLVFEDLSSLVIYGWDPHLRRVVSSLLDPNFSGGLVSIMIALSLTLFVEKSKILYLGYFAVFFVFLVLTFSRSSYAAFLVIVGVLGFLKSPKIFFMGILITIVAFSTVGRFRERMIGVLTLDDTSRARLVSWGEGIEIFRENFLFGVGFNTYRYAQAESGNFEADQPLGGHSGAGVDSSLLLIAVTTGLFGFSIFLVLLYKTWKIFLKNKTSTIGAASLSLFLGLLVHSQFVNSFFFPQIMFIFWFLVGLNQLNDS